jgi:hypothetical protein
MFQLLRYARFRPWAKDLRVGAPLSGCAHSQVNDEKGRRDLYTADVNRNMSI